MRKFIVFVVFMISISCCFANDIYEFEDGYAAVMDSNNCFGIIDENHKYVVEPQYWTMQNLGEGYFFVCDKSYSKYVIDTSGKRVTNKDISRAYHASGGKIPVEGYENDEAGFTRIFDVKTKKISEILPNLWIYAGFYNGIACFSTKNDRNLLKVVLVNSDLKRVVDMEFDLFEHRDSVTGNWYLKAGNQEYVIDKNGKLIQ